MKAHRSHTAIAVIAVIVGTLKLAAAATAAGIIWILPLKRLLYWMELGRWRK